MLSFPENWFLIPWPGVHIWSFENPEKMHKVTWGCRIASSCVVNGLFPPTSPLSPKILNTWFNKRLIANPTQGRRHFPHTFRNSYEYLIIIKVHILSCSLHSHIDSSDHVDDWTQNSYQIYEHTDQSSFNTCRFVVILGATLDHTPLKYKLPSKGRDQIRHVNLIKWIINKRKGKKDVCEWKPLKRNVPFTLWFFFKKNSLFKETSCVTRQLCFLFETKIQSGWK